MYHSAAAFAQICKYLSPSSQTAQLPPGHWARSLTHYHFSHLFNSMLPHSEEIILQGICYRDTRKNNDLQLNVWMQVAQYLTIPCYADTVLYIGNKLIYKSIKTTL